ncbi:class I SAM-dependent methyltransferase [Algicella marina]|uniref:Class I SAM-dependent methyltransferase n=1 Tax=Algicella marina TaxID=2683284 RepID=A0A6P1SVM4_9RHOB|nr:SAM-dependent methyltransferase [Algicella marina]QHQ33710.1 class I SAM-dependent methyltransferase [Algicella marina]
MTRLTDKLKAEIAVSGPISIARFMQICLLDPEHGYYMTRDPLGSAGDFTTAPEISQMFGELAGLWLAQTWMDQGAPDPFTLAELGPGRGTLMADILRATARVAGFHAALRLHLVEASPTLQAHQAASLADAEPTWLTEITNLPDHAPLFVVSNEFFDALPIRQFQKAATGWHERCIGIRSGNLVFGLAPAHHEPELDTRFPDVPPQTMVERNSAAEAITAQLGQVINRRGGAFLAFDYGEWDGTGDTLQGLRKHGYSDPLTKPGEADLTAHVGFRWLAESSTLRPHFTQQGQFLKALGIDARAAALSAADPDRANEVAAAHSRLTDDREMGSLFKTLALLPESAHPPPGFTS